MLETISLNGPWVLRFDPRDEGRRDRWFAEGVAGAPPGVAVDVPHSWQHANPEGDAGADYAWYFRRVEVEPPRGGERVWLRFEGVATDCEVYANGTPIGANSGCWTPFRVEATEQARSGGLEIAVRVDRRRPEPQRWVDGGVVQGGHPTKGFHDVLSMQVAGIWDGVLLERSGPAALAIDGLEVLADARSGMVRVRVHAEATHGAGEIDLEIVSPGGEAAARESVPLGRWGPTAAHLRVPDPLLWDTSAPNLYTLRAVVRSGGRESWRGATRFGFRTVETRGRTILLNGRPLCVSGILDWGHEPDLIRPAPSPEAVRRRFAQLRSIGINTVCVCMWYPPRHYYDIADETGMLVWQEHPTWKSPMGDELLGLYREQMDRFFRRDQNHPSVAIVSGSCEHERFNPRLADWWWREARERMPDRLLQVQTAFLHWTDLGKTDLYDEHTYENSGVWADYLEDIEEELARREPKPFVMGESVLYTGWPDTARLRERADADRASPRNAAGAPWWCPLALPDVERTEREIGERFGAGVLSAFLEEAHRFALEGRKRQTELVRMSASRAGLVHNALRDMPICPSGFLDNDERLRYRPEETLPWTADAVLLLRTPDHARAFPGGSRLRAEIGIANFSGREVRGPVRLRAESEGATVELPPAPVSAAPGEVAWRDFELDLPAGAEPAALTLRAGCDGAEPNAWTLWGFPEEPALPPGAGVLVGLPYREEEIAPVFEERRYSSGWGFPMGRWRARPPVPHELLPDARPLRDGAPPADASVVVTHRLTDALLDWAEAGGRLVLLPSRCSLSLPTRIATLWGQSPLVTGRGPTECGRRWIVDLLDLDLHRRWVRSVPTGEIDAGGGPLSERVEPLVRLLGLHDARSLKVLDALFATRVGGGLLVVSCFDHWGVAGRRLLRRTVAWAAQTPAEAGADRDCPPAALRAMRNP